MRAVLAALAACLMAAPCLADQPLLRPTHDVAVTYRLAGPARLEQTVRWLAAAQTMRIDPPTAGLFVIVDYLARRMSVVRVAERSVIDMAAPDSMAGAVAGKSAGMFKRSGEATVAGLPCTEWQTNRALVCITADGVLLQVGTAAGPVVSAVSVSNAPQDPALFRVPAGFSHQMAGAGR